MGVFQHDLNLQDPAKAFRLGFCKLMQELAFQSLHFGPIRVSNPRMVHTVLVFPAHSIVAMIVDQVIKVPAFRSGRAHL